MTAPAPDVGRQVRQVGRSVGALAAGEIVNKTARFAAAIVLARALPLDEFGLLNTGIAVGGILVVLLRFGLPELGAREIAAHPERAAATAGRIVAPQAAAMAVVVAATALIVAVVDPDTVPFAVMAVTSMAGMSLSADWLLRGSGRMGAVAVATAAGGLVVLAGAVVVTSLWRSATAALAAFALGELVAAAVAWRATRLVRDVRPTVAGVGPLLRRAWPLAASGIAVYAVTANVDTLVLAATRSPEEAGLYSAPYRLFWALAAVVVFAGQALLPVVTRAVTGTRGRAEGTAVVRACIAPLVAYGLAWLAVAEVGGRAILGLVFGDPFREAADVLVLLALAIPWYAAGFPAGYALIAKERGGGYLRGAAVAGVMNIGLVLALVPPFGGTGAALATVAAFAAGACVWLREQGLLSDVAPFLALLAAASGAAAVATVVDGAGVVIGPATLAAAAIVVLLNR